MPTPVKLIPRDELVDDVVKRVLKGQHAWLDAPEGHGKTTIIQEVVDELQDEHDRNVIFCEESTRFKQLILDIAQQLHAQQLFAWEHIGEAVHEMSWAKLHSRLHRRAVLEVAPAVLKSLEGHDFILVLDHLEGASPAYQKYYALLFEAATVIAASNNIRNPQIKKLRSYARTIEVPKLTPAQGAELSDFLYEVHRINACDEETFKQHLLRAADGIPLKLVRLYEDAATEDFISMDYIRQLRSQAGREYVSMVWLLLMLITLPMAARIMALGSGDRDAYVAFGVMAGFGVFMRYLVYQGNRG